MFHLIQFFVTYVWARTQCRIIVLKNLVLYVNFPIFRVCFVFLLFFVFVSCLDLGFSCLYRYTRNTRFSCFVFPSLNFYTRGVKIQLRSASLRFVNPPDARMCHQLGRCYNSARNKLFLAIAAIECCAKCVFTTTPATCATCTEAPQMAEADQ